MKTIKDYKVINNTFLVVTDESLIGLDELYPYDMVQIKKSKKKLSKKEFNAFINENWEKIKAKYKAIIVIGSELFKFFTKVKKAGNYQTEIYSYDGVHILQGIKYHNSWLDKNKYLYEISQDTIHRYLNGLPVVRIWEYVDKKQVNIIEPEDKINFKKVEASGVLVIDFETLGVRAEDAEIYSVSVTDPYTLETIVFKWEKRFISQFKELIKGKTLVFHNALFDMKMIITNMFMNSNRDLGGMRDGIIWLKENVDINDTMLMVYHCNNNTQGNELGLKFNALKYTGVYAIDVTDIAKALDKEIITEEQVLEYNAIDTIATSLLYKEYLPKIKEEDVGLIYSKSIESIYYLIELMIIGLPVNKNKLDEVNIQLTSELDKVMYRIKSKPFIKNLELKLSLENKDKINNKLKSKIKDLNECKINFKISSNQHLQRLLYNELNLPIIEYTQSRQPSTSGDTLKALKEHTSDSEIIELLNDIKNYFDISKILSAFIIPFYEYIFKRNNTYWMTSNHKIGGTVSGRLSSNNPNFAQLPSGSKYGKLVKSIFQAPKDWLFCGSDYNALEARIGAILTNDPERIKVYTQGFDSHSLATAIYWSEKFKDIDLNNPKEVNRIKKEYSSDRSKSKSISFALQYNGTAMTLHKRSGFSIEEANRIYDNYCKIFYKSIEWAEQTKKGMQEKGYVRGCWGHKIKTPLIKMSLINHSMTPSSVKAEFRTANNAISQSYGMLTVISGSRFQELIERSPYKYDVFLINNIHDAIYLLVKNDPEVVKWVNENLINTMCIMDEPKLIDAPVKLEAELDIGKSWDKQVTLKNNISIEEIKEQLDTL